MQEDVEVCMTVLDNLLTEFFDRRYSKAELITFVFPEAKDDKEFLGKLEALLLLLQYINDGSADVIVLSEIVRLGLHKM